MNRVDSKGVHHGYLGLALMLAGFLGIVFSAVPLWICWTVNILGFLIYFDDARQHSIQRTRPEYRSPLNRFYGRTLYRIPFFCWINDAWDKILGKPSPINQ
jgi:hypothetical protein